MHDPMTVAFEIKSPLKKKSEFFPRGYRNTLVTIWHVDPEKDGTDDSCGWFKRERHGDKATLERAVKRIESDWDRVWVYDPSEDAEEGESKQKQSYPSGMFFPNGMPRFSVTGIMVNIFFAVALEHFRKGNATDWKKAKRFMQRNIFEIIHFAENPVDSMFDSITLKYGNDERRDDRIRHYVSVAYGYLLRLEQKWWQHPRWHFWHWQIQVHCIQSFKRWAFSRCCKCGKGFSWGYSPCTDSWNGTGPLWFRSEKNTYHSDCHRPESECCARKAG